LENAGATIAVSKGGDAGDRSTDNNQRGTKG
jgi:hypothetical protein